MPENNLLYVTIYTREEIIYQGPAVSLTSYNEKGKFDVLSKHTNFISIIDNKVEIRDPQGGTREVPVSNAIMRVVGNRVDIFLGIKK